jgi:putative endonuclease
MYLYILYNKNANKHYIGITKDLNRRLLEHNSTNDHYTGKVSGYWELLYSKWFNSKIDARKEEIRLKKSKNKKYLDWYILNK